MTYIGAKHPPDCYKCVRKINNRMKETYCGPIYSLQHMLSNLLNFDIEYVYEKKIAKWSREVVAKVNNTKFYILTEIHKCILK